MTEPVIPVLLPRAVVEHLACDDRIEVPLGYHNATRVACRAALASNAACPPDAERAKRIEAWHQEAHDSPMRGLQTSDGYAVYQVGADVLDTALELMRSAPASDDLRALRAEKDGAYKERDRLVCALSKLFPSWLDKHVGEPWDDDWRWIVFVQLPTGQVSWHIHDSELAWFPHLTVTAVAKWDGHTTEEKYARLDRLASSAPRAADADRKAVHGCDASELAACDTPVASSNAIGCVGLRKERDTLRDSLIRSERDLAEARKAAAEVDQAGGDAPHEPGMGLAAWIRCRFEIERKAAPDVEASPSREPTLDEVKIAEWPVLVAQVRRSSDDLRKLGEALMPWRDLPHPRGLRSNESTTDFAVRILAEKPDVEAARAAGDELRATARSILARRGISLVAWFEIEAMAKFVLAESPKPEARAVASALPELRLGNYSPGSKAGPTERAVYELVEAMRTLYPHVRAQEAK